jgi:hypothetical protein
MQISLFKEINSYSKKGGLKWGYLIKENRE